MKTGILQTRTTFILCSLFCLALSALAEDLSDVSSRDLERGLDNVQWELSKQDSYLRKLESAGRHSNNANRRSVMADLLEHMLEVIYDREDMLSQNHTIKQHGKDVETGLTDAAEVGTPIPNKKTRRRVRKGEAEEHPAALRRLTRMQTIIISAKRIEVMAANKQADSFETFTSLCSEFADILRTEEAVVLNEMTRREQDAAAADSAAAANM
ncbi:hypothetical protein DRQ50_10180 [bacterium]|nr:MAG: hypothetical protein DRQ50_10180 [bacterium]